MGLFGKKKEVEKMKIKSYVDIEILDDRIKEDIIHNFRKEIAEYKTVYFFGTKTKGGTDSMDDIIYRECIRQGVKIKYICSFFALNSITNCKRMVKFLKASADLGDGARIPLEELMESIRIDSESGMIKNLLQIDDVESFEAKQWLRAFKDLTDYAEEIKMPKTEKCLVIMPIMYTTRLRALEN